jgi:pimeloyl-ACP methyl ester carboxylesterase
VKQRLALSSGAELDIWTFGDRAAPPVIFLHGFPESHRTWRHQLAALSDRFFCIAPDQRGYAGSSKPGNIADYTVPKLVADVFALADALGVDRFTLVGHDWGGAIAWAAALADQSRVERLIICNAPHPYIFQKTLIENMAQRQASQYIREFRERDIESEVAAHGLDWFFDDRFGRLLNAHGLTAEDRAAYLDEWSQPGALTGMLNWYRASPMQVPQMEDRPVTTTFLARLFPRLMMPILIIWGLNDAALLPCQLEGLDDHIENLKIVRVPEAGHFVPWEAPEPVTAAMRSWLR